MGGEKAVRSRWASQHKDTFLSRIHQEPLEQSNSGGSTYFYGLITYVFKDCAMYINDSLM